MSGVRPVLSWYRMKRITQFSAVVFLALLTVQPVLASLSCALGGVRGGASSCPMGMSEMGADCPMASHMVDAGCSQNCCAQAGLPTRGAAVKADKLRVDGLSAAVAALVTYAQSGRTTGTDRRSGVRGDSPPRHILNQVFRI
jgi:hypothetical protein